MIVIPKVVGWFDVIQSADGEMYTTDPNFDEGTFWGSHDWMDRHDSLVVSYETNENENLIGIIYKKGETSLYIERVGANMSGFINIDDLPSYLVLGWKAVIRANSS